MISSIESTSVPSRSKRSAGRMHLMIVTGSRDMDHGRVCAASHSMPTTYDVRVARFWHRARVQDDDTLHGGRQDEKVHIRRGTGSLSDARACAVGWGAGKREHRDGYCDVA